MTKKPNSLFVFFYSGNSLSKRVDGVGVFWGFLGGCFFFFFVEWFGMFLRLFLECFGVFSGDV